MTLLNEKRKCLSRTLKLNMKIFKLRGELYSARKMIKFLQKGK